MKRKKLLKMNKKIIIVMSLMSLFAVGKTFAWVAPKLSVDNELSGYEVKTEIEENFEKKSDGNGVIKQVSFKNTGDSSAFIRMSYAEYWNYTDENGERWQLSNTDENGKEIAVKKFSSEGGNTDTGRPDTSLWEKGTDGWFYYKKVVPAGASVDNVLLEVTFPGSYENGIEKYETAEYHLYFKVEAVQASTSNKTLNRNEVNARATSELFGKLAWAQISFDENSAPQYPVTWHFDRVYTEADSEDGGSDS